jgi:20S proteasome subunit beta 6
MKNQGTFELNRSYTVNYTKEQVINLVKDAFISAAERDIYTGDALIINVVSKEGVAVETFPLRRD